MTCDAGGGRATQGKIAKAISGECGVKRRFSALLIKYPLRFPFDQGCVRRGGKAVEGEVRSKVLNVLTGRRKRGEGMGRRRGESHGHIKVTKKTLRLVGWI